MRIPILTFCWITASFCLVCCVSYPAATSDFIPNRTAQVPSRSQRLPDPRFRPPFGVWEIDRVASMVAKATGRSVAGTVTASEESPLARIHGPLEAGEIQINPCAAATIPPNSWAFIIGHEFAHRTHGLTSPKGTDPEMEMEADAIGARYAINAGFDLAAHIDWTLSHVRDGWSPSHGSIHERALRLAERYGLSGTAMW